MPFNGSVIIQNKYNTKEFWELLNPILRQGEVGYEVRTQTDFNGELLDSVRIKMKVGDGIHTWNELPYVSTCNLQNKYYPTSYWVANNPVLLNGELGFELATVTEEGETYNEIWIKIGDGKSK